MLKLLCVPEKLWAYFIIGVEFIFDKGPKMAVEKVDSMLSNKKH